jgi:hypothetical protein
MNEARGRLEVAVQHKGVEVRAVGPRDGPQLVVYANLRKEVGVGKWLEHGAVQLSCEIDITRAAVAEADSEPVVAQHLRAGDLHEVHPFILRQWVDRLGGAAILCVCPVRFELDAVQSGPLCDEFERARRQITDQHLAAIDRDHGMVLGILGMEMWRFVIVEVHRDRDAVEEADPGHIAMMTGAWDGSAGSAIQKDQQTNVYHGGRMANHKRGRPKQRRAGCLLCKPHKLSSAKKAERRRGRRDAMLHELRATQDAR